jgi:hypothetical protein
MAFMPVGQRAADSRGPWRKRREGACRGGGGNLFGASGGGREADTCGRAVRGSALREPAGGTGGDGAGPDRNADAARRPSGRPEGRAREGHAQRARPSVQRAPCRPDRLFPPSATCGVPRTGYPATAAAGARGRPTSVDLDDNLRERGLSAGSAGSALGAEDHRRRNRGPGWGCRVAVRIRPQVRKGGLAEQPDGRTDRLGDSG